MFDLNDLLHNGITDLFNSILNDIVNQFSGLITNVMSLSKNVLEISYVQNGISYAQGLAFTLLILKTMNEAIQTYYLYQNGDPDSDPSGLLVRTAQATAVIAVLPWIVTQIFIFGTKVALDITELNNGSANMIDVTVLTGYVVSTGGLPITIAVIIALIMLLIIAIQASIRGAELALMAVLGPIMALNLTANNRSTWSAWFKQILIICVTQAIQLFMIKGAFSLVTVNAISSGGVLLLLGWLWVTIKSPKFIQQFSHSTGFTGAVGGTAKQAGSMAAMKLMMK